MAKLDPEFKAKWIAALRSGEFIQGHGLVRNGNDEFCCLGVAGVLCGVSRDVEHFASALHSCRKYHHHIMSPALAEHRQTLVTMNDGAGVEKPRSFSEIADYIEANL